MRVLASEELAAVMQRRQQSRQIAGFWYADRYSRSSRERFTTLRTVSPVASVWFSTINLEGDTIILP